MGAGGGWKKNNEACPQKVTQEIKAGFWPAPTDFCWGWGGDSKGICHWVREWVGLWPAGKLDCCRIKKDISVAVTGYYFLSKLVTTRNALVVLLSVAL